LRYFHVQKLDSRIAHENLIRRCCVDYDREIALVAEHPAAGTGEREVLGVGRLRKQLGREEAELGVLVTDRCQGGGLGRELVARVVDMARAERVHSIVAHILPENTAMLALARRFGFEVVPGNETGSLVAVLKLVKGN
jgi:acetyltransferase